MNRRRLLLAALAAPAAGGLAGCGGWLGPRTITLDEADLAQWVARSFPQTRRLADVLEIELGAPQIRLLPDLNRLSVALSLHTRERLKGGVVRASLQFDSALRYEPQDASLRLSQVRVQQVAFTAADAAGPDAGVGVPAALPTSPVPPAAGAGQRLAPALAERVLEDLVIYRLSAERQASLRQRGLQPGAVNVTPRGLEITLVRTGT